MNDRIKALEDALEQIAKSHDSIISSYGDKIRGPAEMSLRDHLKISSAISSALAASRAASDCQQQDLVTAARVRIKPLVWEKHWTHDDTGRYEALAFNGLMAYHVNTDGWWFSMCGLNKCNGLEAAKAAAQADYEARILAALDLTPAPAVEPVAMTAQDAERVPEIAALIEAADHLLQNYLRDELDEPDLCVDDDHWSAIHEVNAALRAIGEGE